MTTKFYNLMRGLAVIAFMLVTPRLQAQFGGGGNRGGGGTGGSRAGGGGGASSSTTAHQYYSSGTVGEAMVTSDLDTRRLIVITDEETSQFVGQVVTNLDQPKPQVLINVVFLEATYNNNFDFGVESSLHKGLNDSTSLGVSNVFGGLAAQGAANSFGTPGAGIYQINNSDFTVTLRAIQENGKLEVLSRPSILARNNQQATIMVGQQIPLISNVRFDTLGNQINTVSYQDVGIILQVTPFITSEGSVEMIVSPQISTFDPSQSIPISAGVLAPVINKRSADTVVVTPDGQSVVIGGLMQNSKNETDSRVPILGDIPGLGALFKRKTKGGSKTELIIFLTPHIVRDSKQLIGTSQVEADKVVRAPSAFSEEELNRYLDKMPLKRLPPPKDEKK